MLDKTVIFYKRWCIYPRAYKQVLANIMIFTWVTRTSLENWDDSTETLGSFTATSPAEKK